MTIRVSAALRQAFADLAARNDRTIAAEVRIAMRNRIEEERIYQSAEKVMEQDS